MKPEAAEQYVRFINAAALGIFADEMFDEAARRAGIRDFDFRGSPLLALATAAASPGGTRQ